MDLSPRALIDHFRSPEGRKKLRYAGVSLFFVPVGQLLIQGFGLMLESYTSASVIAAAILTLPNFFANRHFVWRVETRENMRTQAIVFWTAAMLGVSFATGLTFVVEGIMADQERLIRGIAVFFAQLTGFGIVWVGRFLILDRWLFKITHHGREPSPDEEVELHSDVPI